MEIIFYKRANMQGKLSALSVYSFYCKNSLFA